MAGNGHRLSFGNLLAATIALALAVSVCLTVASVFSRDQRETDYELARLGLEDVSRRVEREARNLRTVSEMSDGVALSHAKALALLIAENPTLLSYPRRGDFDAIAKLLQVDELHVSDGKGVLVRSFPADYEGRCMADSVQSAAFMPAITNRAFAFVQDPQGKGLAVGDRQLDGTFFQYAGVARLDQPGIVQVGYCADRVEEALKLSDVNAIAATARVGRYGKVSVNKLSEIAPVAAAGIRRMVDETGRRMVVFETDTAGYRIAVTVPESGSWLADDGMDSVLFVLDLILLILVLSALPSLRALITEDIRYLRRQLSVKVNRSVSFLQVVFSPLTIAAFVVFAVVIAIIAVVALRQARNDAEERLRTAAADIVDSLDDSVSEQLAFIGKTICDIYHSPEEMAKVDMKALLGAYGLDEINAIDGKGIIVASNLPILGDDQWKKVNPAKFNKALLKDGKGVFAQCFRTSADEPGVYYKYVGVAFPPPAKGYLQLGFKRTRLQDSVDYSLRDLASDWHIGESGFYTVSKTKNGEILSCGREECQDKTLAQVGFDVFVARQCQNIESRDPVSQDFLGFKEVHFFESEFDGIDCLCTSGVVNQFHRYIAAIPFSEVYGEVVFTVMVVAVVLFLLMVLVVFFMSRLSNLVTSLKGYIALEKTNRERDLSIARTIQVSSLPVVFPDEEKFKLFAMMDTAKEVGGDFFDFYRLPSGKLFFLIADVSGKGVPAAMFMMKAKAIIKACAFECDDFAAAVGEANARLAEGNDAQMFVTTWFGTLDDTTGEVEYVNAGHNPPLVKRADGTVEWLKARGGPAIAAVDFAKYRVNRLKLNPGDSLFLYTDGVTEAMNPAGELYGEDRLECALKRSGHEFVTEIRANVATFAVDAEQSDDITMLAIDFKLNETNRTLQRV